MNNYFRESFEKFAATREMKEVAKFLGGKGTTAKKLSKGGSREWEKLQKIRYQRQKEYRKIK